MLKLVSLEEATITSCTRHAGRQPVPKAGVLCPNCMGPEAAAQAGADWLNTDGADPPPPPKRALAPPNAALDAPPAALEAAKPAADSPNARPLDPPKGNEKAGAEAGCDPIPPATPPAHVTSRLVSKQFGTANGTTTKRSREQGLMGLSYKRTGKSAATAAVGAAERQCAASSTKGRRRTEGSAARAERGTRTSAARCGAARAAGWLTEGAEAGESGPGAESCIALW